MHTLWPGLFLLACCGLTLDAMMKGTRAMTPVLHDGAAAGKSALPPSQPYLRQQDGLRIWPSTLVYSSKMVLESSAKASTRTPRSFQ